MIRVMADGTVLLLAGVLVVVLVAAIGAACLAVVARRAATQTLEAAEAQAAAHADHVEALRELAEARLRELAAHADRFAVQGSQRPGGDALTHMLLRDQAEQVDAAQVVEVGGR